MKRRFEITARGYVNLVLEINVRSSSEGQHWNTLCGMAPITVTHIVRGCRGLQKNSMYAEGVAGVLAPG
jgi:hypothetical protein